MVLNSKTRQSYRYCEQISRKRAGNFYPAFRVLPSSQRQAMCALYAFLRIADDLSDEPGAVDKKRADLAGWREGLHRALEGKYDHPIHAALHHTVVTYQLPVPYLEAAIDGVEMDLDKRIYQTFEELYDYCFHVASVVGLSCIHIWGYSDESAKKYAEYAGIAFQLTNILRDLGEDAGRKRIYLPAEDLHKFGYTPEKLLHREISTHFRELMRFEVMRAREYYDKAWPLLSLLRPAGRAIFLVMARTYQSLLDVMERRNYDVFSQRITVSKWHKLLLAFRAVPVRCGLLHTA